MKYPRLLGKGNTIGICAPSSGVTGELLSKRLDNAILNTLGGIIGYGAFRVLDCLIKLKRKNGRV